ncbi:MAG: hypothetical protein EPN93_13600 [Spirochaetes bacterium]|nr:MAG: hypothetical protein EPN93_13600 [Spirochaetota bacterium]
MSYLLLSLSVLFNVASYFIYKSIANRQNDLLWIALFALGMILGGVNIFLFTKALKNIRLSFAYPVFSGACIALIMVFSYFVFHERINIYNLLGSVAVIIGIILLSVQV